MADLGNKELGGRVIEAAIKVQQTLGPGFLESIYGSAPDIELRRRGIAFERQKAVALSYEGDQVGGHRVDLLVEGRLLVELKAVRAIEDVFFAIGRSYMKALGVDDGLLLNFASRPLTIRRIGREWNPA
ncbi:MAG TPA: GxxExxY protein [Opitutus sp.]|nr:GxxExxY protein [Opitutus sp.]